MSLTPEQIARERKAFNVWLETPEGNNEDVSHGSPAPAQQQEG